MLLPHLRPVEWSGETDAQGSYITECKVDIGAGRKLKLNYGSKSGKKSAEFATNSWTFNLNNLKDAQVEWKKNTRAGKLKVKQLVPSGCWELVPSPEIKLNLKPRVWERLKDDMELSYDSLTSVGRAQETLVFDGKYKLKAVIDSASGLSGGSLALTALFTKPWISALAISHSKLKGPILSFEVEPKNGRFEVEADYSVRKQQLGITGDFRPSLDSRVQLEVDTLFSKGSYLKPRVLFGVKCDLQ